MEVTTGWVGLVYTIPSLKESGLTYVYSLLFPHVIILNVTLSLEEVEHIAELARLELTDEEKARYQQQLSEILEYVARLQALDTAQIDQTFSVLPPRNILRSDRARPGMSVDDLLRNAPDTEGAQFRIPSVLD